MTGYTVEESIETPFTDYIYHEELPKLIDRYKRRMAGEDVTPRYETALRHKDGNKIDVEFNAGIVTYQGKPADLVIIRDITEHKQAEEELRESEERYRALFEGSRDAIYITTREGKFVGANQSTLDLFGYTREEMRGLKAHKLYADPIDSRKFQKEVEQKGFVRDYEVKLHKKDGTEMDCLFTVSLRRADDGSILGYYGIIRDITDRKRTEDALQQSEERYRTLVEESFDGIFVQKGPKIIFANQRLHEMLGYDQGELLGLDHWLVYHPDYQELTRERAQARMQGEMVPSQYDVKLQRKNGSWFFGDINARAVRLDGEPGVQVWVRDITERKRAEQTLKESEQKYRTIIERIEEGYYEVDIAGNLTFFNDSWCKIFGYPEDELMGMNNREYSAPETAKRIYQVFNTIYRTGKAAKIVEYEIIRKDGNTRVLEMSASLMRDLEGKPIGFRGVARDVTKRKHAEEEKKKLEAQLTQAQRMEALGTLAGGIAHNFNNLLMGMQGNVSLMLLDTDSDHPNYERLNNIEKMVQNGSKLTSQLLGYAREGRYEVRPISLNQLVKDTSNTFGMAKKDITVHQDLDKDLFGIIADQGQIEQVLLNLYVNTADAMPQGGDLFLKTMNVTHEDMKGKPYKVKPGNYALLTVRDTGVGMDKKTKERIFDPFFTTKGLAKGTGLGLASVYGIIKAHGGYIDVYSEKGQGTTFKIYLPASEEKEVIEKEKLPEEVSKGKETVLLVDDEEMILDVGQELLKTLGYKVLIAEGGKEAIDIYKTNKENIDIVILDMIMPVIGGGEVYDRMKEIEPKIKVLLSSGYSINGQATEILKRGCSGFIQKPFTMKELSQNIRDVLEEK
jgi:PAS domain S-box-containing protein